jgi:hypothetical protein
MTKMNEEKAKQIIENIIEQAWLNARDIDEDMADEIEQASNLIKLTYINNK